MNLYKKYLCIAFLFYLPAAFAITPLKCTGTDPSGLAVNVDVDFDAHKLVVNSDELEILSSTKANDTTTITTENDVMDPTARQVLLITGSKGVLNKTAIGTNNVLSSLVLKCVSNVADAANVADSGTYLINYVAEISHGDRYDDDGKRLTTVRAILKQDRARFHSHLSHDTYDSDDNYFVTQAISDLFDTDKINIDPALEKKILGDGNVIIKVYVSDTHEMTVVEYVPPKILPELEIKNTGNTTNKATGNTQ